MNRNIAPVIPAQALLAHAMPDDVVLAYVARTWHLDNVDGHAAVAAARVLVRREHASRT